jgi:tetratricopeptide (TPR) repeat protein
MESVEAGLEEDTESVLDASSSLGMKPLHPFDRLRAGSERSLGLLTESRRVKGVEENNLESLDSRLSPDTKVQTSMALKSPRSVSDVGILSTVSSLDELKDGGKHAFLTDAEHLKGSHKSLKSFSESRFNKHLSSAEDHLKAGRYYRAVDSFNLASVYQPNNPDVLSGKGHALFAAGEYMSSALFLGRALAIQPDYTQTKVDLAAMLGGADKLAERIADVEQWLARSGSAQLQFLLSYVYFRSGRLNQAKHAIAAAYENGTPRGVSHCGMPDSPAIDAMKTAIEQAAK